MDKDWAAEALAITRCTGNCCNTTAIATALRSAYELGLEDAATRLEIDAAGWGRCRQRRSLSDLIAKERAAARNEAFGEALGSHQGHRELVRVHRRHQRPQDDGGVQVTDLPDCCDNCEAPSLCKVNGCVGMASSQELCSDSDITAALALCEAATPGPWEPECDIEAYANVLASYSVVSDGTYERVGESASVTDATFIASARTGWPTALLALREARRRFDELERRTGRDPNLSARRTELYNNALSRRAELEAEVARLREALADAADLAEE